MPGREARRQSRRRRRRRRTMRIIGGAAVLLVAVGLAYGAMQVWSGNSSQHHAVVAHPAHATASRPVKAPTDTTPSQPPAAAAGPLGGDLLIADRGNNRMLLVDGNKKTLWKFPSKSSQMLLNYDDDTFFGDHGNVIVSNQEDSHDIVQIAYPSGEVLWRYGHPGIKGSAPGYLHTPDDAYLLSDGTVMVADAYNCRVIMIRGQRIVQQIGRTGVCHHNPPDTLGAVNGDTPLPNGNILVSEIAGSYIDEFTKAGKLVHVYTPPVAYPSDPQLTLDNNIILADYTRPGGIIIFDRATGRVLWQYRPASGPGELDHPSLAAMLPNGNVIVGDDYNHRIAVINRRTKKIVWQYGHTGVAGLAPGFLHTVDGFDFVPLAADGSPDTAAIHHGA